MIFPYKKGQLFRRMLPPTALIQTFLEQSFLNCNVHLNHLGILLKCPFCFGRSGQGLNFCISNKRPIHGDAPDPNHTLSSKAASLILRLILLSSLKSKVSINTHTAHLHIHSTNLTLSSSRSAVSAAIAAGYTFVQSFIYRCICRGRKCWPGRLLKDGCLLFRAEWAELVICFVSVCVCRDIIID